MTVSITIGHVLWESGFLTVTPEYKNRLLKKYARIQH
jgi:hypothetical protein